MKQLQAAREMAARSGWPITLLFAAHRALGRLSGGRARVVPYAIVAQPIGAGAYGTVRDDPATVVRVAGADDPLAAAFPRPPEINAGRWANGATCHAASVKGQFAGTIWIQRNAYEEDEVRCRYVLADPGTCVWDFDVYVEPRYRLGRTMGRLWKAVDRDLAARGVKWSFSRISLFNPDSLQSHARLGAVTTGHACFLALGRMELAWFSGPPRFSWSWNGSRRPTVHLKAPG